MPTNASQLTQAGTADPLDFRRARSVGTLFADAAVVDPVDPSVVLIPIAGALLVRLRGKMTTSEAGPPSPLGEFTFAYRRNPPNQATAYDATLAPPHAAEVVEHDTEFLVDIAPGGEPYLAITFTPDAGIDPGETLTSVFLDVLQQ